MTVDRGLEIAEAICHAARRDHGHVGTDIFKDDELDQAFAALTVVRAKRESRIDAASRQLTDATVDSLRSTVNTLLGLNGSMGDLLGRVTGILAEMQDSGLIENADPELVPAARAVLLGVQALEAVVREFLDGTR